MDINKKIWVAGHNGMVGSALCRELEKQNANILTVNKNDLDLTRQQDTENWINNNKPDIIIIAAARVGGIMANSQQQAMFLYENLAIAQNIIHGAKINNVEKLLYLGSSCIYPFNNPQPIKEDHLLNGKPHPTNEGYAIAKIAGIKLCEKYKEQYGCNFISAMPCNLYGQGDLYDPVRSHVIPALIMKFHEAKIHNKESVEIWGSGNALREFLYVDDLAKASIFLLNNYNGSSHVNIGYGKDIAIKNIVSIIANIIGYKGKIIYNTDKPEGAMKKLMDSSKINNLGWKPSINLSNGIEQTYKEYLKLQD